MATGISTPTDFSASTTTVIFTIVGVVVIDVTVIIVITTAMNNVSELAMKRSCVEALPGAARYPHLKHARLWSVASEWTVRMTVPSAKGQFSSFPYDGANSIWN